MAVDYKFKKGVDLPSWQWLAQFPGGSSQPGTSNCYDGVRYMYWSVQTGSGTAGTASTTAFWRYDTWNNGWQFLTNMTNGNRGIDLEFDNVRNVVWALIGVSTTEWRYFNLNTSSITLMGLTTTAFTMSAAITTVLPNAATDGSSLAMIGDSGLPATYDGGVAGTGSTTTSIVGTGGTFWSGTVGLQMRFTSGAASGQKRIITGFVNSNQVNITRAFGNAPAAGDAFVIELPADTATTGATTSTLVTLGGLLTNAYRDSDVVILSGTGAGQRRRIASNDATTLTLASTTTGNPRTGTWTTAPDATSVYQIVPSSDFLYFMWGSASANFSKIDVVATTPAWAGLTALPAASAGGGNLMAPQSVAPFRILAVRGNGTGSVYYYDVGLNSWVTPAILNATETFTTGASSGLLGGGRRKLVVQKDGSSRMVLVDLVTGQFDAFPLMPYSNPTANEGKRIRYVKTADGVEWLYIMRAGGQEFFRIALEWL